MRGHVMSNSGGGRGFIRAEMGFKPMASCMYTCTFFERNVLCYCMYRSYSSRTCIHAINDCITLIKIISLGNKIQSALKGMLISQKLETVDFFMLLPC